MSSKRFAMAAVLLSAVASQASAQMCPIPPAPTNCLQLNVGEVRSQVLQPGQVLCVEPGAATQEFTVVPVNYLPTADAQPAFLANNVIAVTGPPSPRPAESGALALAPLAEPVATGADGAQAAAAAAAHDELTRLLERKGADALVAPGHRGKALPTAPPQVDDLIDIQVNTGCTGAPDLRKARFESVTPSGPRRIYIAQEVSDPGNTGTWTPAIVGGFTRSDFDAIRRAYEEPAEPPTSIPALGTTSITTSGGHGVVLTNFGASTDIDGNGGIVVFFTRRLNEAVPPASSSVIFSRFEARDLFSAAPASCPRSNEGEIIYMVMPDPTGAVNSNVRTTSFILGNAIREMTHQITRLTHAGRRLYVNGVGTLEEPWLDETLGWMSSELLFFNNSAGLTPRNNIVVTSLTTGPVATRRVAAFNSFANPIFSALRVYYLQSTGGRQPGRNSVLATSPDPATVFETANERISYFYGVTAAFLRYALDRANGDEAATLRAIVDSPLTGQAKLEAIFGADMRDWARDFGTAMYADDNAFAVPAIYQTRSWHYRSIYIALNTSYLLTTASLTSGVPYTPGQGLDQNGGLRWLRFGVAAGTPGVNPATTFQYTVGGSAPMTPLRVTVTRTK